MIAGAVSIDWRFANLNAKTKQAPDMADEKCKEAVVSIERKLDNVLDSQARIEEKVISLTDYLRTTRQAGGESIGEHP